MIWIAQQRKIQLLLDLEAGKRFYRIGAHAKNHRTGLLELPDGVTKLGRFGDSTGSIGFREEEQNDMLALKILE